MKNIELVYPSFTKKALTFTIDDGNMKYDAVMLEILKPAGIKGTFNLCSNLHLGREKETYDFYRGYEIANHCKFHPIINYDGVVYVIADEPFDETSADVGKIYKVDGKEGFYWFRKPNGWREMVFEEDFITYIKEGKRELEEIFGLGSVRDFVWPYGNQDNAAAHELIRKTHRSSRITGCTADTTAFAIPTDKYAWSYNANDTNLLEIMEKYEQYPDDGELKFFAFGVHSIDFERDDKWDDLKTFADKYGNRPDTYWYASIGDIYDYLSATKNVVISDGVIENTSDVAIYLELSGERIVLSPKEKRSI